MIIIDIILGLLFLFSISVIASVTVKKPVDPLINLRKELEKNGMSTSEINDYIKKYKESFKYSLYELQMAYYELGKSLKDAFKK